MLEGLSFYHNTRTDEYTIFSLVDEKGILEGLGTSKTYTIIINYKTEFYNLYFYEDGEFKDKMYDVINCDDNFLKKILEDFKKILEEKTLEVVGDDVICDDIDGYTVSANGMLALSRKGLVSLWREFINKYVPEIESSLKIYKSMVSKIGEGNMIDGLTELECKELKKLLSHKILLLEPILIKLKNNFYYKYADK